MGSPKAFFRSTEPLALFKKPPASWAKKPPAPSPKEPVASRTKPAAHANEIPEVRALRRRMRLTQREFAGRFGFPLGTLKQWERGNRKPTGAALVLICVIHENPGLVMRAVRKARQWRPGMLPAIEPRKSYRVPPGYAETTRVWKDF